MVLKKYKSPNYDKRAGDAVPSLIILHYTGMKTAKDALERLCDPASKVSAHYVVEERGRIHHLVPDDKRAWHAGTSYWAGEKDINSHSIGIEIVNPGHEHGYRPFPPRQINAVLKLCRGLMKIYDIKPWNILGHSDIAPARKQDPGELFPWQDLAEKGVGLWPDEEIPYEPAMSLQDMLAAYGYNPDEDISTVIAAFHRHFRPEKFVLGKQPFIADGRTLEILGYLLRKKLAGA